MERAGEKLEWLLSIQGCTLYICYSSGGPNRGGGGGQHKIERLERNTIGENETESGEHCDAQTEGSIAKVVRRYTLG